ncbi:MAG: hypothetical protein ACRC6B_00250 [Fusobacteriaceae bacterium]
MITILPTSGTISIKNIADELSISGSLSLNDSRARSLAGRPSGTIQLSHFHGKRIRGQNYLLGVRSTEVQGRSYSTGTQTQTWANIPTNMRMATRVYGSTAWGSGGSASAATVYIKWTIRNTSGTVLFDSVRLNQSINGNASDGIGQWSQAYYLTDLVGQGTGNVSVTITCSFTSGDYVGRISSGSTVWLRRINGIDCDVGY